MKIRKAKFVRLALFAIGISGAITGLLFGFSNGQIDLILIPGLSFANTFSGIAVGTLGILIAAAEGRKLYLEYQTK